MKLDRREPAGARSMHILHVIDGIDVGGAELVLVQLVEGLQAAGHRNTLIALTTCGPLRDRLLASGASVVALGMRRGRLPGFAGLRLMDAVRRTAPDLIQGWMYHGNLAASAARRLGGGGVPLAWSIHNSIDPMPDFPTITRFALRASRRLSGDPETIIYVSDASAAQHERHGFRADRTMVIPNGTDCTRFRPRPGAGGRLRAECGVPASTPLVGMLARWHPVKGHRIMFRTAARLIASGLPLHLVLAGTGLSRDNAEVLDALRDAGLSGHATLLGQRQDVEEIVAGLDLLVLPSIECESFPLVLGEAMAAGVPCIASDLGDCRRILGDVGAIVPPADPAALEEACGRLLAQSPEERALVGAQSRARVERLFSLERMVAGYAATYQDLILRNQPAGARRGMTGS